MFQKTQTHFQYQKTYDCCKNETESQRSGFHNITWQPKVQHPTAYNGQKVSLFQFSRRLLMSALFHDYTPETHLVKRRAWPILKDCHIPTAFCARRNDTVQLGVQFLTITLQLCKMYSNDDLHKCIWWNRTNMTCARRREAEPICRIECAALTLEPF